MPVDAKPIVLVVDDNNATRYSTGRFLRAAGFEVKEAATGTDALEIAKEDVDAIVLDVNLPDVDGFEVCRRLRAWPDTARTPIIHLSATFVGADDQVHGLDVGADGYLTHPVEPPVLVATVNAFLRARSAEDLMRRSEAKFRSVFDHAANGIALMNDDFNFLEANPAMCAMLGRTHDDLIGKPIRSFLADAERLERFEAVDELRAAGAWTGTRRLTRADGVVIDTEWSVSMHSGPAVWLAVVTDISERVAAEKERDRLLASERAARTEAERASRLKDEFLATVSHELRTPLNAILGWTQLLRHFEPTDKASHTRGIDAIDRNARVQVQLIGDLLDVSRITSGKLRLDIAPVDVGAVVQTALENIVESARVKSITIEQKQEAPLPVLTGDAARLQQVFTNLFTNAVKFTPEGGRITVRLKPEETHLVVTVSDTGEGISPDFLPHIFDSFRQEAGGISRPHSGLGLGLAIVKRLVEMHGGTITAASGGKDEGAEFAVRLPLSAADDPAGLARVASRESDVALLRGLRVLIVDDDPDARMIVRRSLADCGVTVTEAASMEEALAAVQAHEPEVMISDIGMPVNDGYKLIRTLRERGIDAVALPAIALTAFDQPSDRREVTASGFQAHLSKPVDLEALMHEIARLRPAAPA